MKALASPTTYNWTGATSSSWSLAGNWNPSGIPTFNATEASRLNVGGGTVASRELVYDASLATTVYGGNTIRGLVIGSGSTGTNRITGGTFSTAGNTTVTISSGSSSYADLIANGGSGTGYMIIDGGNYISGASGLQMGINNTGSGTLTMNSGTATITTLSPFNAFSFINMNGGTLAVNSITYPTLSGNGVSSCPNMRWYFNGGTLKARTNTTTFFPLPVTPVLEANVRNGGAIIDTAGFNITVAQPLFHSVVGGDNAIDGGIAKQGGGTLTMTGFSTYTGPTIVNSGTLAEPLPQNSSSLVVSAGGSFYGVTTNSAWSMASAALTNAYLGFNYGSWLLNSYNNTVLNVTNLVISGVITCNITGTGFPITNLTLLSYASGAHPGSSFALGNLPAGAAGNLVDDGSNVVLKITAPSIQSLVWSGGDGIWQTNGGLDWNSGANRYLEYPTGLNDVPTFDDTSSGNVTIQGAVKPGSPITVNDTASYYNFVGTGKISGSTGINKLGTSTLNIYTTNDFTGVVNISGGSGTVGGTLFVDSPKALGATNGGTIVSGPANTLELENGVTVTGETITINGTGVGGARGALRGSGSSVTTWAGPVVVGSDLSRIGTEDNGQIVVTGPITDNGADYTLLLRAGANGRVTLAGGSGTYGNTRTYGGADSTGIIKLGANNSFSTNILELGLGSADLNGYNQTLAGINDVSGPGTIINNGGVASVLTINMPTNTTAYTSATIQDGSSPLSIVKYGAGNQTLNGPMTYTGNTSINEGSINITTTSSIATSIAVAAGATLLSGEFTTTGSLTLSANSTLQVDPTTATSIAVGSLIASVSPVKVKFTTTPTNSPVLILSAAGGVSGAVPHFQAIGSSGTFYADNSTNLMFGLTPSSPTLNYTNLGGGVLRFSWTGGGTLQSQTNSLAVGLGTNWVDCSGSSPVTVTVDPTLGSIFYRLKQ